jgi:hypothetical protein
MADQGQVVIIRVRVGLFHLVEGEHDVADAAVVLHPPPDIFLADLGHHRIVARKIVLDADDHVATRGEGVGEEGVLGALHRVAVTQDRNRQIDHLGDRFHLAVAAHGKFDRDVAILAQRVKEGDGLVVDRPFACGEIAKRHDDAERKQNDKSAFHINLPQTRMDRIAEDLEKRVCKLGARSGCRPINSSLPHRKGTYYRRQTPRNEPQ